MKQKIHALLMVLSLFGSSIFAQSASAQFREEVATLENMYESRARTVLNTVLRPHEYSLVVSAEIERDEAKLGKIKDEYERNYLPGMPGMGSMDSLPVSNQIHELKSKIDIHIVLANTVPKEKEETIRSVIKMKLHLDESSGDTIALSRALLPIENPEKQISTLPELSWKMWTLILILSLLALAGLLMFLHKRQSGQSEKDAAKEATPLPEPVPAAAEAKAEEKPDMSALLQVDPAEVLYEQKKQMISFSTQYPEATIRALTEYFQKGHENEIVLMCESFGWELSKKIFAGFSPRIWGKVGHHVMTREKAPSVTDFQKALESCYKVVLSRYLEMGDADQTNPFGFIWKLNANDRRRLLDNETSFNLALICVNSDREQMGELLTAVSDQMQEAVTIQIARLQSVPQESIRTSSEFLLKKLKQIQENPEVRMEGSALAADLLRSLPPEKELQLFERLMAENPGEADGIRRHILIYSDIVHVPSEVIAEISSLIEIGTFVDSMRNGYPGVREHILRSMPPKRAAMIEKDLYIEAPHFSARLGAKAQREVIEQITTVLKIKGIELTQLIPGQNVQEVASAISSEEGRVEAA